MIFANHYGFLFHSTHLSLIQQLIGYCMAPAMTEHNTALISQQTTYSSPMRARYGVCIVKIWEKIDHLLTGSHSTVNKLYWNRTPITSCVTLTILWLCGFHHWLTPCASILAVRNWFSMLRSHMTSSLKHLLNLPEATRFASSLIYVTQGGTEWQWRCRVGPPAILMLATIRLPWIPLAFIQHWTRWEIWPLGWPRGQKQGQYRDGSRHSRELAYTVEPIYNTVILYQILPINNSISLLQARYPT